MKTYPHLSEMGVLNPQQIDKFSVNSIDYTDVLRISYERPKGSVLPQSRTYKFPRIQKSTVVDSGTGTAGVAMESNPALRAALEELQDILRTKGNNKNVADAILEELRLLEEDVALRREYLKVLAGKIQSG